MTGCEKQQRLASWIYALQVLICVGLVVQSLLEIVIPRFGRMVADIGI